MAIRSTFEIEQSLQKAADEARKLAAAADNIRGAVQQAESEISARNLGEPLRSNPVTGQVPRNNTP